MQKERNDAKKWSLLFFDAWKTNITLDCCVVSTAWFANIRSAFDTYLPSVKNITKGSTTAPTEIFVEVFPLS